MGLAESSGPSTTAALKHALSEFGMLHGVKKVFERAEEKFGYYEKTMKLRGEVVFSKNRDSREATDLERNPNPSISSQGSGTFTSWLFNQKFMPGKVSWKFGLDPNDELVTGKFLIGDYISLEGNAGERNDVFLMFRYEF